MGAQHYGYQEVVGTFDPRPLPSEPPPPPPLTVGHQPDHPPLVAKKIGYYMPISEEQLRWAEEDRREREEARRRWEAMTPAEQERATAEWEAQRAREKAERTCETCGCDPDEHGGY